MLHGSSGMAKIQLRDLTTDVELDREAMTQISGGRGSISVYRPRSGLLKTAASGRSANNTLFGKTRRSRISR